jgi:hypothetical protein
VRIYERLLLRTLQRLEASFGPLRQRLEAAREDEALARLRATYGSFPDGSWARVVAVPCDSCRRHVQAGDVVRIKRFTTEGQRDGEWVIDRPKTAFLCAGGVTFEPATAPVGVA